MNASVFRFAGWSAYANAVLSVAILVTLATYFVAGEPWGSINDSLSVIWSLSFLPLVVVLYKANKPGSTALSLGMAATGILSMLAFSVLQSLLVMGVVRFEQTFLAVVSLGGIFGLVILSYGLAARSGEAWLPSRLAWLMIAFGLGYGLSAIGFWLGGWENPLAAIGYLASAVTGPAWSFWLARLLLNNRVLIPA